MCFIISRWNQSFWNRILRYEAILTEMLETACETQTWIPGEL